MHMTGIVFEGGTFRPIFSCGVMDALLSENILLPYCIGVSAGIADGVSYISKQPQRNLEIMQKYGATGKNIEVFLGWILFLEKFRIG